MRKIYEEHKIEYFNSKVFSKYFGEKPIVVFDIETMGLSARTSEVVLAAFLKVDPSGDAVLEQYLLDSMEEEILLLSIIRDTLNQFDLILTFNGKHFDIPFIKARAQHLGMRDMGLEEYDIKGYNLDLYLILHGHSDLKKLLPNLKQKTIEEYMGIADTRKDEITGADSIILFKEYLSTLDFELRECLAKKILLHNHDDVLQLYKLLPILSKTDFHRAMYKLGYPIEGNLSWPDMETVKTSLTNKNLNISGIYKGAAFTYFGFSSPERPYEVKFNKDRSFEFSLNVEKLANGQFVRLKDFFSETDDFKPLSGYVRDCLVLSESDKKNFREINYFSKALIEEFIKY